MKISTLLLSTIFCLCAFLHAGVPSTLNYQGRVLQNDQPFEGTGHFVFGIYEGSTLLWTNKLPTPSPLNDPAAAIDSSDAKELSVRNGVFTVRLGEGDVNNAPVGTDVFFKFDGTQRVRTDVKLAVWFSPVAEGPYTRLDPDITFASVPFAQVAGVAESVRERADGLVPPGTVVPFAGTIIPDGWVLCDGRALDGSNPLYAALGEAIATIYGAGLGAEFLVPDMRSRVVLGSGDGDGGNTELTARNLGEKLGSEKHTLSVSELPDHQHGLDLPTETGGLHQHKFTIGPGDGGARNRAADGEGSTTMVNVTEDGEHAHQILGDTQGDKRGSNLMQSQPHNNMQPSLVLNYIIKL